MSQLSTYTTATSITLLLNERVIQNTCAPRKWLIESEDFNILYCLNQCS